MTAQVTLNNRQFYRSVIRLAIPIAAQSLIASSLSLVDNLMVGSLGEAELAAVGAGIQIFMIHYMFLFGFCSGSATFIAQFYGVGDIKNIKRTIGFTAITGVSIGGVFFVAAMLIPEQIMSIYSTDDNVIAMGTEYIRTGAPTFLTMGFTIPFYIGLRATQQTHLPLFISISAFVTNTFMNYVLIFGSFGAPRLETQGAAVATVMARCLELIMLIIVVFIRKNLVGGRPSEFIGLSRELILRMVKNNIPTTANETFWGIGQTMYMAAIGHISVTAYAATQACHTIENVFVMAGFSLGDAALIMLGEKLGQNEIQLSRMMASKFIKLTAVIGIILGILLLTFSQPLLEFFKFSDAGYDSAIKILVIYAAAVPAKMVVGVMITGILRSGGDTTFAAVCELSAIWIIAVPLAFLGAIVWHLPVYAVVILSLSAEVVEITILLWRTRTGKWANNVVSDLQ
ncbi:MAG: MATE family efflux transporter [Bacillota bacterium]|nr:MATE family efflux transporter [Bacillota bacterium]